MHMIVQCIWPVSFITCNTPHWSLTDYDVVLSHWQVTTHLKVLWHCSLVMLVFPLFWVHFLKMETILICLLLVNHKDLSFLLKPFNHACPQYFHYDGGSQVILCRALACPRYLYVLPLVKTTAMIVLMSHYSQMSLRHWWVWLQLHQNFMWWWHLTITIVLVTVTCVTLNRYLYLCCLACLICAVIQ